MQKDNYIIRAFWDEEAEVWVASSMNFIGLAAEDKTIEGLLKKIPPMIQDLLEVNDETSLEHMPLQLLVETNAARHAH
jgi:hypothetical protein